ncbi:MAG: exo-alpha-sialidase [Planctomycetes bacterium]|nr:exo-alpha-sialidase [Planctomycetota bacterium]
MPALVAYGAVLALGLVAPAGEQPELFSELIFPPEKWHNHASCVVEATDGSLLVCWYHGSGERKADDVIIEGARKRPGQTGWSRRFLMADTPGYPDCNPAMYVDSKQRLWLFWPTIMDHHWESALLKYRLSSDWVSADQPPRWDWQDVLHITPKDLGPKLLAAADALPEWIKRKAQSDARFEVEVASWRERAGQELYQRLGWMPRAHPTRLRSGKWILPLYCDTFSISIMVLMDEDGQSWELSTPLIGFGNIQPSVAERRDGTLVAVMRENGATRRIRTSESRDGGKTWGPVGEMNLPNPGSGLEMIRLANGHFALIYNDTERGRHSLAVSISDDEGRSCKWTRHLELTDPGKGSFSYPSIIQSADGSMHATFSFHVSEGGCIKYAHFNEAWVQQGDPAGSR